MISINLMNSNLNYIHFIIIQDIIMYLLIKRKSIIVLKIFLESFVRQRILKNVLINPKNSA